MDRNNKEFGPIGQAQDAFGRLGQALDGIFAGLREYVLDTKIEFVNSMFEGVSKLYYPGRILHDGRIVASPRLGGMTDGNDVRYRILSNHLGVSDSIHSPANKAAVAGILYAESKVVSRFLVLDIFDIEDVTQILLLHLTDTEYYLLLDEITHAQLDSVLQKVGRAVGLDAATDADEAGAVQAVKDADFDLSDKARAVLGHYRLEFIDDVRWNAPCENPGIGKEIGIMRIEHPLYDPEDFPVCELELRGYRNLLMPLGSFIEFPECPSVRSFLGKVVCLIGEDVAISGQSYGCSFSQRLAYGFVDHDGGLCFKILCPVAVCGNTWVAYDHSSVFETNGAPYVLWNPAAWYESGAYGEGVEPEEPEEEMLDGSVVEAWQLEGHGCRWCPTNIDPAHFGALTSEVDELYKPNEALAKLRNDRTLDHLRLTCRPDTIRARRLVPGRPGYEEETKLELCGYRDGTIIGKDVGRWDGNKNGIIVPIVFTRDRANRLIANVLYRLPDNETELAPD